MQSIHTIFRVIPENWYWGPCRELCRNRLRAVCRRHGYALAPAAQKDMEAIAPFVTAEEVLELWNLHGIEPRTALERAFAATGGKDLWTLHGPEGPLGMGGLTPVDSFGMVAEAWFLGVDMRPHARFLAQASRLILTLCLYRYPILINMAGCWNEQSMAWLRHAGFTLEEEPVSRGGAMFRRFYAARGRNGRAVSRDIPRRQKEYTIFPFKSPFCPMEESCASQA